MDQKMYIYNKEKVNFSFIIKVIILIAILALAVILVFKYTESKNNNDSASNIEENFPQKNIKLTTDETNIVSIATQIFYNYMDSFNDKNNMYEYIENSEVISCDVKAGNIDEFVSDISFRLKPGDVNDKGYCNFGKIDSNGYINSSINIRVQKNGTNIFNLTEISKEIDINGLVEYEKYKEENETLSNNKQYDYKIQGNILKVTYNGGSTWSNVDINFTDLNTINDADKKISDTSFVITPSKTMFAYGGDNNTYIKVTVSNDKGKTWNTYNVEKTSSDIIGYYMNFSDKNTGNIIAVSKEGITVYQTFDGGIKWETINTNNLKDKGVVLGGTFATKDIGFITFKSLDDTILMYRTDDRATTWQKIELKLPDEITDKDKYLYSISPVFEGNNGYMLVKQHSSEIKSGSKVAKFITKDYGITWTFEKIIKYN